MFFDLDRGLNRKAHEWLSWALVIGAVAHIVANWKAFRRYLVTPNAGRAIVAVCVVVLAGSFVRPPQKEEHVSPPVMAMKAITRAPLTAVAPLTGRPAEQLVSELAKAGIKLSGPEATLESATKGDRETQGKALAVLFPQKQ